MNVHGEPQFSCLPQGSTGDAVQTAYQVRVTATRGGAVVWDSGMVESSDQSYVPYGKAIHAIGTTRSASHCGGIGRRVLEAHRTQSPEISLKDIGEEFALLDRTGPSRRSSSIR